MEYGRINWKNGSSGGTPFSAENLNIMDKGIDDAKKEINDTKSSKVSFTSNDSDDESAISWSSVDILTTGETHASILSKVSKMFRNIRYLNKKYDQVNSDLGDVNSQLAHMANEKAPITQVEALSARLDDVTAVTEPYYEKCLSTDTGALLVVETGEIAGQINLVKVTPAKIGYTPIVGDYVRYVYGSNAEIVTQRTNAFAEGFPTSAKRVDNIEKVLMAKLPLDNNELETLIGYYNGVTYTASASIYSLSYDVANIDTVYLKGTFLQYNNVYTTLNGDGQVVKYSLNNTANFVFDGIVDCKGAVKLLISAHADTINTIDVKAYQNNQKELVKRNITDIAYLNDKTIALLPLLYAKKLDGYYANATYSASVSKRSYEYDLTEIEFVKIIGKSLQYANNYTFLDSNGVAVKYFQATTTDLAFEYEFDTTTYAKLIVSGDDTHNTVVVAYQNSAIKYKLRSDSNWKGKKIVWFGTSIPAGGYKGLDNPYSYPNIIGRMLGCNMYNEAVGSSTVHCKINDFITANNPNGYMSNFQSSSRCLSNDLTDMDYIIANWNNANIFNAGLPTEMTAELENDIRSFSWQNKLNQHLGNNRADLYVFDVGYNDIRTLEGEYNSSNPLDRHTFKGAMNFLLSKIFTDNPHAKVVMIGHYENQLKPDVALLQKDYANTWNLDLFPLWEKLGFSQMQITTTGYWNNDWGLWIDSSGASQNITMFNMWLRDGVHPHSDFTHRTERYIAETIYPWINSVKPYDTIRNVTDEFPI